MRKIQRKRVKLLTALFFLTFVFTFNFFNNEAFASTKRSKKPKKPKKSQTKSDSKSIETDSSDFLPESDLAKDYVPKIYRCPECGYEQDMAGFCPDHNLIELTLIVDRTRNPLAPPEYDGNEDILVDIPLKNLQFKKEQLVSEDSKSDEDSKTTTEE